MNRLITGPWYLKDLEKVEKNGLKVFSCFHCGGGSTMGYKLAGFEVLGGVEIDSEMMKAYKENHNPKLSYLMGVQDFNKIPDSELPKELFELDILDGSPPCSSFSMAGSREKAWGDEKRFREGQAKQVLDDLFFHFIDTAAKLRPKVVVAENVKGLIIGKAKGYVKQILKKFDEAGYDVQLFLLNAAFMGVPQKRERTFFIARRKDLGLPKKELNFNETPISVEQAWSGLENQAARELTKITKELFNKIKPGQSLRVVHPNGSRFNEFRISKVTPCATLTANSKQYHHTEPRHLSKHECLRLASFPDDYDFKNTDVQYICGMSVPPFMMQRISNQIAHQLFGIEELKHG